MTEDRVPGAPRTGDGADEDAPSFDTVTLARQELADGGMVIVVDDEDRENEGDLTIAAEHVTPADVAFMVRHTSGVLCVALTGGRCDDLDLPLMVGHNTESMRTAFTHTVDLAAGTTTGISAADRAATIRALADDATTASDFNRRGHVCPLRALLNNLHVRLEHYADLVGRRCGLWHGDVAVLRAKAPSFPDTRAGEDVTDDSAEAGGEHAQREGGKRRHAVSERLGGTERRISGEARGIEPQQGAPTPQPRRRQPDRQRRAKADQDRRILEHPEHRRPDQQVARGTAPDRGDHGKEDEGDQSLPFGRSHHRPRQREDREPDQVQPLEQRDDVERNGHLAFL